MNFDNSQASLLAADLWWESWSSSAYANNSVQACSRTFLVSVHVCDGA